jgi:AraC-like DNA-binding protein
MNVSLVYLCAFSLLLSLILFFYNKGYKGANRFLSGYLFCSTAFLLSHYFLIYSKSISLVAFSVSGIPSLIFLIGPFAYFYVRSILRDNPKLSKTDFLHFLPFLLIFTGTIPFLFSTWEHKCLIAKFIVDGKFIESEYSINFLVPKIINQSIRPPFALLYLVLISREFIKNRNVLSFFSYAKVVKIWLGLFFLLFSLKSVFYIIAQLTFFLNINFLFDKLWIYYLLNSIAFVYLVFNFSLILFPQILYGLPIPKRKKNHDDIHNNTKPIQNNNDITIPIIENKLATLSAIISNEYELEIESVIHKWIADKKYLEENVSLVNFSNYTNIPVHHLSYYFNSILKVKYPDWRNALRIEYAKAQIDSGLNKSITLEALSLESGFSSQSTFIRSFKNVFGCTPSDYIKTKD